MSSLVRQCCEEHFGTACSPPLIPQPSGLCRDVGEQQHHHSPSHPLCASHLSALQASLQKPSSLKNNIPELLLLFLLSLPLFLSKEISCDFFFNLTIQIQRASPQRAAANNFKGILLYRDFWSFPFSWWHRDKTGTLVDRIMLQRNGALRGSKVRSIVWNSHY